MFEGHILNLRKLCGDFRTATAKLYTTLAKYSVFVDKFCNIIGNSFKHAGK